MGYSKLGGTPLPMYRRQNSFGQRTWRRQFLAAGALFFVVVNLLVLRSFAQLNDVEASEEGERLRAMRARPGAPIMSDAEALAAMCAVC